MDKLIFEITFLRIKPITIFHSLPFPLIQNPDPLPHHKSFATRDPMK